MKMMKPPSGMKSRSPTPSPAMIGPGGVGSNSPGAAIKMSQPKMSGGDGFLINQDAFTDARPPAAKGQRRGAGYPNYGSQM